jgi:hypothetical protein
MTSSSAFRMTLGNTRELGVHHPIAFCLKDSCRHHVSSYPAETEVPWFKGRVKCGGSGNSDWVGRHKCRQLGW